MDLSVPQSQVFQSSKRFRVLVAGRRFGKTHLAIPELVRWAWGRDKLAWYIAPTYKQAKMIAWDKLKKIAGPWITKTNETELSVTLCTGGSIRLHGAENYDSLRGPGLNGVVFDEFADIDPRAWTEVVRPMLSDRLGSALFIGTPKGFNHFKDMRDVALTEPGWGAFQFTTIQGGNVEASEIEAARHDLDEKTFKQEYEASFENLQSGQVYYAFDRIRNVRACNYLPVNEICWSLDFNVNPMCSVIAQIHDASSRMDMLSGRRQLTIEMLDEICLPDSNIPEACGAFVKRTEAWATRGQIIVHVYGDPAGSARTHAGKSDWQLVREYFARDGRYRLEFHIPPSHPAVKDRINAVNAALLNSAGETRLWVDPCNKDLIRDLEQVTWKADSHGNSTGDLDKANSKLTHVSDAAGYLIEQVLGLRQAGGYGTGFMSGGRN